MGEEIAKHTFDEADFMAFNRKLAEETALLRKWVEEGSMSQSGHVAGAELEAWLVDETCRPVAKNIEFLERFNDPLAVPELSLFNVEFNCLPAELQGNVLSTLENNLQDTWTRAGDAAADLGLELAMIGILPTVRHEQMCTTNMSHSPRYEALSEQLFRLRKNKPIQLAIEGRDRLETTQTDLMLEAATTSFQIHLQVSNKEGARYYNASKIASAALVAVAANSPYLFGKTCGRKLEFRCLSKQFPRANGIIRSA